MRPWSCASAAPDRPHLAQPLRPAVALQNHRHPIMQVFQRGAGGGGEHGEISQNRSILPAPSFPQRLSSAMRWRGGLAARIDRLASLGRVGNEMRHQPPAQQIQPPLAGFRMMANHRRILCRRAIPTRHPIRQHTMCSENRPYFVNRTLKDITTAHSSQDRACWGALQG